MRRNSTEPLILCEDNHLIIVNKQPGDIVQGDKTGDRPLSEYVKAYIGERYKKPGAVFLGVVHRLDRPVSGAVIFARTSKALTRLNEMLRQGEIRKTYWAVVKNQPPAESGNLVHHLVRKEALNRSFAYDQPVEGSQRAELNYRVISQSKSFFLLEVDLLTGRHHQIRAQLSAMNMPIRGDLKYGYPRSNPGGSIHLHARRLTFIHPVSKILIDVEAMPPQEALWDAFLSILRQQR